MGIYNETPLVPLTVATSIACEARRFMAPHQKDTEQELTSYLVTRAETSFAKNRGFRIKMKGDLCREWLYTFMRHWCASRINVTDKTRNSTAFINWANGKDLTY
jgi:hypothetical protein